MPFDVSRAGRSTAPRCPGLRTGTLVLTDNMIAVMW